MKTVLVYGAGAISIDRFDIPSDWLKSILMLWLANKPIKAYRCLHISVKSYRSGCVE